MAPGLNYGQQCYEGLKAFRDPTDRTVSVFRPSKNAARMQHSAAHISIPAVPSALFTRCVHLAVSANAAFVPPHATGAAMYIRPLLFGSSAQLGLTPPEEYSFLVYVLPVGVYHGVHPVAALVLEDFDRAAPRGTGSAKVGGNYAPVLRWSDRARDEGYGITLHLDSGERRYVDEFSTSGFIGVKQVGKEGEGSFTLVVPDSDSIIDSVTSDSVCEIARGVFGWRVERRKIPYEELPSFTEVLAAGTAAALVPIKSIECRSKGDVFVYHGSAPEAFDKSGASTAEWSVREQSSEGEPGPACVRLLTHLKAIQTGKAEDKFGWLEKVEAPPEGFVNGATAGGTALNGSKNLDGLP